MGKVIKFRKGEETPDELLDCAKGVYESLVVIGYDNEGFLQVTKNNLLTPAEINFMIDQLKRNLIEGNITED